MPRLLALTSALSLLLAGCANDADTICDRRKECFSSDLDTGKCAEKISAWEEERESEQESRQSKTARCAKCTTDRTCAEILASCVDDCFGIP
jgi:hypothetical protein